MNLGISRYVGKDLASKIYQSNLVYEEYEQKRAMKKIILLLCIVLISGCKQNTSSSVKKRICQGK